MTVDEARAAARQYMVENSPGYSLRSCWNCNAAHERLKEKQDPINCFECGRWFYNGVDITADDKP